MKKNRKETGRGKTTGGKQEGNRKARKSRGGKEDRREKESERKATLKNTRVKPGKT